MTSFLSKNWRVSEHGIFNGTMRIARFDFDTAPSDEVKQAMYGEILTLLTFHKDFAIGTHKQRIAAQVEAISFLENKLHEAYAAIDHCKMFVENLPDMSQRMPKTAATCEVLLENLKKLSGDSERCANCGKWCNVEKMLRPFELITDDLVCGEDCAEAMNQP